MSPASVPPRLLLIDDGPTYAAAIADHLPEFALVRLPDGELRASDGPAALSFLREQASSVDAVLLDMHFDLPPERLLPLPGASSRRQRRFQGLAILRAVREIAPRMPVVLLTSEADLSLSDLGAQDSSQSLTYVLGGDDLDALRIQIHSALRHTDEPETEHGILWGRDLQMTALRRRLQVLARGRMPVILEGETGTGKSFLAEQFVHRQSRRAGAFVVLDLSTIPSDLVAAHLFGAARGAYTGAVSDRKGVFEAADGGSLFIDEIQNVPLEVQKQLLLVLQDGRVRKLGTTRDEQVDVKVVVASNQPLSQAVAAGRFRADLYMRLSPATRVIIPPLRARPDDLHFFMEQFTQKAGDDPDLKALRREVADAVGCDPEAPLQLRLGLSTPSPSPGLSLQLPAPAARRLQQYAWPGNLRELSMVMYNLVSFTLVAAVDALSDGLPLTSPRLQVDSGLVDQLLSAASAAAATPTDATVGLSPAPSEVVTPLASSHGEHASTTPPWQQALKPAATLNQVAQEVERHYMMALFEQYEGDFGRMAEKLLGDRKRARAVRLRFNQLGLRVRDLRQP